MTAREITERAKAENRELTREECPWVNSRTGKREFPDGNKIYATLVKLYADQMGVDIRFNITDTETMEVRTYDTRERTGPYCI